MKINFNPLITGALLILAGVLTAAHFSQDKEREQRLIQNNNDLQQILGRTESELRDAKRSRDSLGRASDSLLLNIIHLTTTIVQKDKELEKVRGSFDKLTDKELEQLMIEEWKKR